MSLAEQAMKVVRVYGKEAVRAPLVAFLVFAINDLLNTIANYRWFDCRSTAHELSGYRSARW